MACWSAMSRQTPTAASPSPWVRRRQPRRPRPHPPAPPPPRRRGPRRPRPRRGGQNRPATAAAAASESLRRLALVDRGTLAPEDFPTYESAAIPVATIRWLADPTPPTSRTVAVSITPSRPGQTCIRLQASKLPPSPSPSAAEHCTHSVASPAPFVFPPPLGPSPWPWPPSPAGPSSGFSAPTPPHPAAGAARSLPPGPGEPGQDIGYVEPAGFTPDGRQLLIARELRTTARLTRRFELLAPDVSTVAHWSSIPDHLIAFRRWASPAWRQTTLSLR